MITRIAFPCKWEDGEGVEARGLASFVLGPGPCGKTVAILSFTNTASEFIVRQRYDDGTLSTFAYMRRDITGRIEMDFA